MSTDIIPDPIIKEAKATINNFIKEIDYNKEPSDLLQKVTNIIKSGLEIPQPIYCDKDFLDNTVPELALCLFRQRIFYNADVFF